MIKLSNIHFIIGIICIASIWACGDTKKEDETNSRPNILWIFAEDLSPDLACYGKKGVLTPHLDQLAAEGMLFKKAFTTASVCAPSRSAMAVGMYQNGINAHHMRYPNELKNPLPEGVLPINEIFRRNGYQTANIKDDPGKGKTDWSFSSPHAHYDIEHWKDISKDQPFFAAVNLRLTHRPFDRDTINPIDPATVEVPPYYPNHQVSREDFGEYLESVQLMDGMVGQVLDSLENRGLADNTIIVFLGDHGRPMHRGKTKLYDSGLHIPLIIKVPSNMAWSSEIPKGSVNSQLVSALDLTATTLAFAGISKPDRMQGRVLFGDTKEEERNEVYGSLDIIGGTPYKSRSVRTHKWKYIKNFNYGKSVNELANNYRRAMHPIVHLIDEMNKRDLLTDTQKTLVQPMKEEELYDIVNDPFELYNLAYEEEYVNQLDDLRSRLAKWQSDIDDDGMREDSEALKQAFQAYIERTTISSKDKIKAMKEGVLAKMN